MLRYFEYAVVTKK